MVLALFAPGLLIELEGLGKPNLKIGPMMVLHVSCEWGSSMAGFLGKVTVVHQTFFFLVSRCLHRCGNSVPNIA